MSAAYRRLVRRRAIRRQIAHIASEAVGAAILLGSWAVLVWLWKVAP